MTYLDKIAKCIGVESKDITITQKKHTFEVFANKEGVASFHLQTLPGCCGICVSYRSCIAEKYRKKGLGSLLNSMRIVIAKEAGFGLMLCTDVVTNIAQRKILNKNGWKELTSFVNPRTGNTVSIHAIDLNKEEIQLGFKLDTYAIKVD